MPAKDEGSSSLAARMQYAFNELVPHNKALGLRVEATASGDVTMRLPYDRRLVGDPEHGTLHGGAITAMMDACCGLAVFMELDQPKPCATLDLRIDYLRRAQSGRDVLARAEVNRVTTHVAFVRALAFHQEDPSSPIAAAAGTFMIGASRPATARGSSWPPANRPPPGRHGASS